MLRCGFHFDLLFSFSFVAVLVIANETVTSCCWQFCFFVLINENHAGADYHYAAIKIRHSEKMYRGLRSNLVHCACKRATNHKLSNVS